MGLQELQQAMMKAAGLAGVERVLAALEWVQRGLAPRFGSSEVLESVAGTMRVLAVALAAATVVMELAAGESARPVMAPKFQMSGEGVQCCADHAVVQGQELPALVQDSRRWDYLEVEDGVCHVDQARLMWVLEPQRLEQVVVLHVLPSHDGQAHPASAPDSRTSGQAVSLRACLFRYDVQALLRTAPALRKSIEEVFLVRSGRGDGQERLT